MDACKARELLDDPNYAGRLSMDGLQRLLVRAGYPPEVAHKASMQRGWDRLTAGELM